MYIYIFIIKTNFIHHKKPRLGKAFCEKLLTMGVNKFLNAAQIFSL